LYTQKVTVLVVVNAWNVVLAVPPSGVTDGPAALRPGRTITLDTSAPARTSTPILVDRAMASELTRQRLRLKAMRYRVAKGQTGIRTFEYSAFG